MPKEIEVKLRLDSSRIESLVAVLARMAQPQPTKQLFNTYFDRPDAALARSGAALRIRADHGRYQQTLKTRGQDQAGLQIRGEWNWPLMQDALAPALLAQPEVQALWPQGVSVEQLQPVFTTHFQRRLWLWQQHDTQIEIALDQGAVAALGRQQDLCELELELLRGDPASLWSLLLELSQTVPLWLSPISKAERGYDLATIALDWLAPADALGRALAVFQRRVEQYLWAATAPISAVMDSIHQLRVELELLDPTLIAMLLLWRDAAQQRLEINACDLAQSYNQLAYSIYQAQQKALR